MGFAEVTVEDMKRLVAECRRLMPDVGIQIPPNLADWWDELVEAGATDLGGLSANGDHISPEHAFPSPHEVRKRLAPQGYALTERLCVYPQYLEPEWMDQGVLDVVKLKYWSFIPRRGSGRREEREIDPDLAPAAIERALADEPLTEAELTALFAERRPEVIEDMRVAADSLRAELAGDTATFVVNRNINFTNVCVVGCAFCGFGQGRRSPDAYEVTEDEFQRRIAEAVEFGATEICMQGGIHPDYELADYGRWLSLAKEAAPQLHLHAYSPMEVHYMCERSGPLARPGLRVSARAGPRLDAGHRGRGPGRRRPGAHLAEQAARRALGRDHRGLAPRRPSLDLDRHVRPHRGAVGARPPHARDPRASGAHGRHHGVRAAFVHPLPHDARPHARDRGDLARGEPQAHRGLPPGARPHVKNLQASWVKMGIDAATESLRWGVNDLGGTLMEESISRMAGSQHGDRLDPEDLIGAARAAGRTPAQRTTLYEIVETYPAEPAALSA